MQFTHIDSLSFVLHVLHLEIEFIHKMSQVESRNRYSSVTHVYLNVQVMKGQKSFLNLYHV